MKSRQNATFWPIVGETGVGKMGVGKMGVSKMGVGKMGVGEEVPIRILIPPKLDTHPNYYLLYTAPCVQLWVTCSPKVINPEM